MSHYGPNMCHLTCDEVKVRARTDKEQRAIKRGQVAHAVRITAAPDEVWSLERCEQILARDQAELKRARLALDENAAACRVLENENEQLRDQAEHWFQLWTDRGSEIRRLEEREASCMLTIDVLRTQLEHAQRVIALAQTELPVQDHT